MLEFEERLRELNVIEKRRFRTAAGHPANRKINLEKVHKKDLQLAAEIAGVLAIRLCLHSQKPDLIIAVPDGANRWGQETALHMRSEYAQLSWQSKKARTLDFASSEDKEKVDAAQRIAIVDDVFTTGGSISRVAESAGVSGKVVVAGVIWNRSGAPAGLSFPVETLIDTYVPLLEDN